MTTSARCPSTAASTQIDEMRRAWPRVTRTSLTAAIASAKARDRLLSAAANSLTNSWSPRLKSASRSAISTRSSGSRMPSTSTHSPKRSSSCGRSSPSSGFMVPTRMKREGCENDTPSLSTEFTPIAAASSSTSTMWSSRRLTSSTYRMLRLASARTPGSKRRLDVDRAVVAILGGVDRQLDDTHAALVRGQESGVVKANLALGAKRLLVVGVASEVAALDHVVLRKKAGKRPHRRRLAGALFAANQHAADRGHDGVQDQGQLHRVLAHDRREREDVPVEYDAHLVKNRWGTKGEDY